MTKAVQFLCIRHMFSQIYELPHALLFFYMFSGEVQRVTRIRRFIHTRLFAP